MDANDPAAGGSDLHRTVVHNLFDGVYYVDRNRTITYWNPGAERISGYAEPDVVGRRCYDNILGHVDDTGRQLCKEACPLVRAMAQRRGVEAEVFLRHREGHRVPVHVRCQPIRDPDGTVVGAVEIFNQDSTYQTALTTIARLEELSTTDELTTLPNRRAVELSLRSRLADARDADWPLGVLFADIDHFKRFNDRYGHAVGDEVLRVVGRSLRAGLRESDLAGRWGGEEFVILTAASDHQQLEQLGARLRALVGASAIDTGETTVGVTLSIGATLVGPADTVETLVERADAAMYASKQSGRDRLTVLSAPAARFDAA